MGKPRVDKGQDGQEGITEYTIVVNNDEAFANHAQAHVVQWGGESCGVGGVASFCLC